jgi:hypothetical protein
MTRAAFYLACLPAVCSGCAEPGSTEQELRTLETTAGILAKQLRADSVAGEQGVVVRLMFEESVDLDLYVTDPLLETVYFARHESRTGGRIREDVRCETTGPRIEEIRFSQPWPGRYRVGVDFPRRCDGFDSRAPAPFAVSVTAYGATYETHGLVELEFFRVVVLEFDIGKPGPVNGEP